MRRRRRLSKKRKKINSMRNTKGEVKVEEEVPRITKSVGGVIKVWSGGD